MREKLGMTIIEDNSLASTKSRYGSISAISNKYKNISSYNIYRPHSNLNVNNGIGNLSTGTLTATIYFIADPLSDLTDEQLFKYILNFKASVSDTWTKFTLDDVQINLDNVSFLLIHDLSEVYGDCENENIITVGNGESLDPESAEARNKISYVDGPKNNTGYFFYTENRIVDYASHEFGHIFGLSDRYHEVYKVNVKAGPTGRHNHEHNMLFDRSTIPMHESTKGIHKEDDYDPMDNLMSGTGNTLTKRQLKIVMSNNLEKNYPTATFVSKPRSPQPYGQGLVRGRKIKVFDKNGDVVNNAWYIDKSGRYHPDGGLMFDLFDLKRSDPTWNNRRERNNKIVE